MTPLGHRRGLPLSLRRLGAVLLSAASLWGCDDGPPAAPQYYQRVIQPILTQNCVFNQGACHRDDGTGNALGNLDLSSYAALSKRRDVLRSYGSYPVPLLLLKASGTEVPPIPYKGVGDGSTQFLPSQIVHAGGATLSVQSSAYFELQRWLDNGATETGSPVEAEAKTGTGACRSDFAKLRPREVAKLATVDVSSPAFKSFTSDVEPLLTRSCAFSTCHSSEQSDFFITCQGDGSNDASKLNFLEAQAFVGDPPETSQLLLKPLAPSGGGITHTGGVFFSSKGDAEWKQLLAWATQVGVSAAISNLSEGQRFFNASVMPVLIQRGCALEACHSPGAANDLKLRAGSHGFFSSFMLENNYRVAREFLAPEAPDVRQSRIVKKPIVSDREGGLGIIHRGGPPLETPGSPLDPLACPQPWSAASSAFCTMVEWHRLERQALLAAQAIDPLAQGGTVDLVVVSRPPDADRLIDFDTYRPGADLLLGRATLGTLGQLDAGSVTQVGSLLGNCPGAQGTRDVRGPDVSYDGSKVAFAMRLSASDSLDLYEVSLDATRSCTKITDGNGQQQGGILLHNLDPMYAPDGSLVFASTRGRPGLGPRRSPKFLLPQTDLWRMLRAGGAYGAPEPMTALTGSELSPAMMANGQVTFTAEKASADFYQLSGRRINWDLTDYHPLLAQRAQSRGLDGQVHPSVGYTQATQIREGIDRDFVFIASDTGAAGGGGALAVFNRSIGPFQADRGDISFLRALTIIDPAASGRAGPTQGAYRSPFPLPDGRILVSYDPAVRDLGSAASLRYDLVVVDPRGGGRVPVGAFSGGGTSYVDAALVYRREPRPLFRNLTQLVFGGHADPADPTHGVVHYTDLPMLGTLLGANLRSGRFVEALRSAREVAIYEAEPPPADPGQAMAGQIGSEQVYQQRKLLGRAPLASDGSVHLRLPALTPLIVELIDGAGQAIFTMSEEDQLGPGERISRGVPEVLFNSVCGGCHGSVSGQELDIAITPDALTGASVSLSRDPSRIAPIGP